ncbi:Gfo/Idh/MocA family protein [Pedobacter immunditicola]|uniref:Gfo/Idh/MocA family protein n=1 Tax=Pedobacter immunditicola TaxID=3133440 RepID=UPI0030A878AD
MKQNKIGVGIIGANTTSWAAMAHIPALQLIPEFELIAVSTTNMASAKEAADKFGAKHAFDKEHDLVNHPDVDLVVVAVKVPYHYQLVKAAIDAGKMIYCEWPLGNGTNEAKELAAMAAAKGLKTFIGLQAVSIPEITYLKAAIADGLIGEVLSSSMLGSGGVWGPVVRDESYLYLNDPKNGATMMDIAFSHSLAGCMHVLGNFKSISSTLAHRRKEAVLLTDQSIVPQLTIDQVAISGILKNDALVNVHYRGGMSAGINFHWEINGTKGDIVITGDLGQMQLTPVKLQWAKSGEPLAELPIPAAYLSKDYPAQPVRGLYAAYKAVLSDLQNQSNVVPDFNDGVTMHQLLDRIHESSLQGKRISL